MRQRYRMMEFVGGPNDGHAFISEGEIDPKTPYQLEVDGELITMDRIEDGTLYLNCVLVPA